MQRELWLAEIWALADTRKRMGEQAEAAFLHKVTGMGLTVLKPWGDSERYDLVVGSGKRLWRVQVKSTRYVGERRFSITARGCTAARWSRRARPNRSPATRRATPAPTSSRCWRVRRSPSGGRRSRRGVARPGQIATTTCRRLAACGERIYGGFMKRRDAIEALRRQTDALKALGATGLYMFGSTARDEATSQSDLDLFIEYDRDSHFSLVELVGIKQLLERRIGVPVDVTTRDSLDARLRDRIEASAERVF